MADSAGNTTGCSIKEACISANTAQRPFTFGVFRLI